jgi:HEAT repeat protein
MPAQTIATTIKEFYPTSMSKQSFKWSLLFMVFTVGCCPEGKLKQFKKDLYATDAHLRNDAALGLAQCGEKASDVVPRLIELLYDDNIGVQSAASYALRKIDTSQARSAIKEATRRRQERRE